MKHLILVRHAETDMAGRFCGHSDPELNSSGRQQLAGIVDRLSKYPIKRIYTSDLRRAQHTADAIAAYFGLALVIRPALREIHFGTWEGLSWNEIQVRDPVLANCWAEQYPNFTAPGGEPFQLFQRRVCGEAASLKKAATEFPIAVVAHAGFIRVLLTSLYGVPEEEAWRLTKDYGSVVVLDTNVVCNVMVEDSA